MDPDRCELSIVMPCLNEAETLEPCLRKAWQFLASSGISGEVIVSDNGSTDGSQEIAQRLGARLVETSDRGYGAAIEQGVRQARGEYIIVGDSDDSYDFSNLHGFVEKLRQGYDLVMGNRFLGGIAPGAMPWKNRYLGNPALSTIGKFLFSAKINDFHCGLRGFSKAAFERLELQTTGMEFASEMVIKATLAKMRVTEIPTTLSPAGRSRPPHLRPWRDGWRHLRFMLLLSPNTLFIYPGMAAILAGLALTTILSKGPVTIGAVTFDVTTLLYSTVMIILGAQSLLFGLLTRLLAVERKLLSRSRLDSWVLSEHTLEIGILIGVLMGLLGLAGGIQGTAHWVEQGLGNLDPRLMFRIAMPSGLLLCLGMQLVLASLFLGAYKLNIRQTGRLP